MKLVPALFRSANVLEIAAPAREWQKRQQAKFFSVVTHMWRSYVRRVWGGVISMVVRACPRPWVLVMWTRFKWHYLDEIRVSRHIYSDKSETSSAGLTTHLVQRRWRTAATNEIRRGDRLRLYALWRFSYGDSWERSPVAQSRLDCPGRDQGLF